MRLGDSEDQARFRARLRDWLRAHVPPPKPGAPDAWTPEALRIFNKARFEAGYAGIGWPVAHGGRGLSAAYQAIYAEESALAVAPDQSNVIGLNMVGPTIIRYGTAEQQSHFLPRILSGDLVFCQGFSEPGAGSDLAAVSTRARPTADGYRLDGEKVWSSYAHLADYCLLLARTDPTAPRHRGLSCFLLDLRRPGVEIRPIREISGDSDFNQIVLTGVAVPADALLGPAGAGWRVAMTTLAHERGTFGITLTARLAVELDRLVQTAVALGAERDPWVRREVALLHVELQGLRYTGYRALAALERTGEPGPESSVLKLRWSLANQRLAEVAARLTDSARRTDVPAVRWVEYWRRQRLRVRTNTIEGGTSEILRGIVAERVLGLPRSR